MAGRLKHPKISDKEKGFISILIDDAYPANKKGIIVKGQAKTKEKYFMKVDGFDELKGYLYFTTYEAGVLDTDKEFMKSEDVDFMHNDLMKNMKDTRMADINHSMNRLPDVWLNEIYKEYDEDGNTIASKGSYYIKENALLMQKAKDGLINGVSICGEVEDVIEEELSKSENENSMFERFLNFIIGKEENNIKEVTDMTKEEIQEMDAEQLAELGLQKIPEAVTEETPKETPVEEVPKEVPNEELEKAQKEVIEKDEKITELEKQVEEITKKFDILDKAKPVAANKDAELKDIEKEITLETWERMDRGDRYNFKIQYPELNKKYEES